MIAEIRKINNEYYARGDTGKQLPITEEHAQKLLTPEQFEQALSMSMGAWPVSVNRSDSRQEKIDSMVENYRRALERM